MKRFEMITSLDSTFWDQYTLLWSDSGVRSVFQAPAILKYFSSRYPGQVSAATLCRNQQLIAAVLIWKSNHAYVFLSDLKSDINRFVCKKNISEDELVYFFGSWMADAKAKGWRLELNNLLEGSNETAILQRVCREKGLFNLAIPYAQCQIASAESPEILFRTIHQSRQTRYAVNRLLKQQKALFEVLTDDSDLAQWVDQFCTAHVDRWKNTSTPSRYTNPDSRKFLLGCLQAWQQEGVLARFSVLLATRRIAFVIGLLEEDTLIHHSTTFDPAYQRLGAGKALVHFMAEWMCGKNLRNLDFGYGDEAYKSVFANRVTGLERVFITGRADYPFITKAKLIRLVRKNRKLYSLYRNKIRTVIRMSGLARSSDDV
jgi:ribosomal protein S18 acetylase RimI-like enzyme